MKVAAVVVTYNRVDMLRKCIECLDKQEGIKPDILIVDNNSTDNTKEAVLSLELKQLKYFNTGLNIGGAGGFSFGIDKASELAYDYCWLMDDDTMPLSNALLSMLNKISVIGASYLCSRVVWKDGTACLMNTSPTTPRGCLYDEAALDLHLIEMRGCSFVSCLIDMKNVIKVGLPIKEFFIYGDDVEYTRRLESCAKGYLDLDSKVVHEMPSNELIGIVSCDTSRIDRYRYGIRNNVYIARNLDKKIRLSIYKDMFRQIVLVLLRSKDSKARRINVIFSSTIKGLHFRPEIEYPQTIRNI